MKKLNKKTINKLNELILRSYPVSKDEITDELGHWENKIRKWQGCE